MRSASCRRSRKLSREQAVYHFLSGYTAKVAGTERGMTEPQATFSACFGAPFMSHHPQVYADLLSERLARAARDLADQHRLDRRRATVSAAASTSPSTRRLVAAALSGELDDAPMRIDDNFGFEVPLAVEGLPKRLLDPRANWRDAAAYDAAATALVHMFEQNMQKFKPTALAAE